ncbi:lactonase family protein [Paenibacillus lemnae]|uniref:Lactonase family protein n=1 Tax=Paenibacillus lemnae TaxID=1330551 RepID=A0A848M8B1_PAELE|nr:lactonase family protein [Paenibacillus lemnae]NMO96322.1 lactonase family protein [Paenibacillus lemnae]
MAEENKNNVYFYIGTYGPQEEEGIHLASLDRESGEMSLLHGVSGIENATFLNWDELNRVLYAVSEKENSEVVAYTADPETHQLTVLNRKDTDSSGTCHLSRSGDGKYLFTTGYGDGGVTVLELQENGRLGEIASLIRHSGKGAREDRQSEAHPHSVFHDPNREFVIVCDLGMDSINLYRLKEGKLVTHREVIMPPGAGPRHVTFHPNGKWMYAVNELNNTITFFAYDSTFGDLKTRQHISTLPSGVVMEDSTAAQLAISPCGRFLYASNRGHDSIVQMNINPETGMLEAVNWVPSGGKNPRHFHMVPGGYLLSANQDSNCIVSYQINKETGGLKETGFSLEVPRPVCICPVEKP